MQLTRHADYALRLLIFLAGVSDRRASIAEVAEEQAVSRTHLMKIANALAHAGFVEATRGRAGASGWRGIPGTSTSGRLSGQWSRAASWSIAPGAG